jgi:hypothetical protein
MKQFFTHNIRAKIGAFLIACLVWGILKNRIEPGTLDEIWSWIAPNKTSITR